MIRLSRVAPLLLTLAVSAMVAACAGGGDDDDVASPSPTPFCTPGTIGNTLTQLQSQVFTPNCALASCHDSVAPAGPGLDLSSAAATHAGTVGVSAQQLFNNGAVTLVVPSNSTASYLYLKVVNATGIQGTRMPQSSAALCQEKLDKIAEWIEAGAPNN